MNLPGRLRGTTLGDLLGALHRARVSGVLELLEPAAQPEGRAHRIYLDAGLIDAVETPFGIGAGAAGALRAELRRRVDALCRLSEAAVRFHVRRLLPSDRLGAEPLTPPEFLHGRPRARARQRPPSVPRAESWRERALLGVAEDAGPLEIRRAFRRLAATLHPDRHPNAPPAERSVLLQRFSELSAAYHALLSER